MAEEVKEGWRPVSFERQVIEALDKLQRTEDARFSLLRQVYATEQEIIALVRKISVPSDLKILTQQGDVSMSNQVIAKLAPKSNKPKAVGADVQLTVNTPGLALQVVDQNGSPIGNIDPAAVVTTLVSDNADLVLTVGADALHYKATVQPNATAPATLSATLAFNSGSPGPFTASVKLLMPVPPVSVPTDLTIIVTGNP